MRRVTLPVLALTALGAVLRFATLDQQSFWLDELVTVSLLRMNFGDMLDAIPESEATPYFYYVLAWPWARIFGFGEVGLRSLSALVGTAVIPVAYGAGAMLVSRRTGLITAALVSAHPLLVWYAQEARSYSLLAFLTACSLLFVGRAIRAPSHFALAGWAVSASFAIATHYFAIFLVVPEAFWLLTRSRPRRPVLLASFVPAVVLLLHVPLLDRQREAGAAVSETSLVRRLAGIPKDLVVGYSFPTEVLGTALAAALVLVGLALLVTRSTPDARRRALVPASVAASAIAVPVVLALVGADYVVARNTILAVVPAGVLLATGYAANRLGLAAAGALCALGLAIVLSTSLDARYGRTDWRGAAERLATPTVPRAIVVTPYMSRSLWSPYLPRLGEPQVEAPEVEEIAVIGLATEGGFSGGAVEPPDVAAPAPPPGFEFVDDEHASTYTLFLYRARRPTPISTTDLAELRLTDIQPGILLQGP